jgi:phage-related protein
MAYIQFNDIPLDPSLTQERSQRVQRAQFGDGYSQVLTDGLNAEQETWQCQTPPLTYAEVNSIESFFLEQKGQAISWIPPFSTKTFSKPFASGKLNLGYTNLSALTLTGYTRPTNYTANLVTGVLTSVDIADGTAIPISLTLAAKNFLLSDGWSISTLSSAYARLSFSLTRVYV